MSGVPQPSSVRGLHRRRRAIYHGGGTSYAVAVTGRAATGRRGDPDHTPAGRTTPHAVGSTPKKEGPQP